ncbi:MAG: RHS repeat-associated core domain-containing protein, partial [Planctomycetota bacterium]
YYPFPDPQEGYLQDRIIDATATALVTTYEYDLVGNAIRIIDPKGQDDLIEYNALDQVVRELSRETSPGSGIRYERLTWYDANDNVVRIDVENRDETGAVGANTHFSTIFEYEILDNRTRSIQEFGDAPLGPFQLDLASLGPLVSEFIIDEFEYDDNRNRVVDRYGEATAGSQPTNVVERTYDERDLLFEMVRAPGDPDKSTVRYTYDERGNTTTVEVGLEDPTPRVHEGVYDGYRRLVSTTDPMGNVTEFTYDANGNRTNVITFGELNDVPGSAGNVRLYEIDLVYDDFNRRVSADVQHFVSSSQVAVGDGLSSTVFGWTDTSQVEFVTNDNGNTIRRFYDTVNRQSLVIDPRGNEISFTYDLNSNLVRVDEIDLSDIGAPAQSFEMIFDYDGLDRRVLDIDSVGSARFYGYDSRSNRVVEIDRAGEETRWAYDGMSRRVSATTDMDADGASSADPDDITTTWVYDQTSRVTRIIDDLGHVTTYGYDALNRRTSVTNQDGTSVLYGFDPIGNVVTTTDPNGTICTYDHDLHNRLTDTTVVVGPGVSNDTTFQVFEYDGIDRVVRAEDDDSVVTRAYDSMSGTINETLNGVATIVEFDALRNPLQIIYPSGRTIDYTYDSLERIIDVTDSVGGPVAEYDYVGRHRTERRETGAGTRTDYTYDGILGVPNPAGDLGVRRIVEKTHTLIGGGTIIDDRAILWDPERNKASSTDRRVGGPEATHTYAYDAVDRLIQTDVIDGGGGPIRNQTYNLDDAGNRSLIVGGNDPGQYKLDAVAPQPQDAQVNQYTVTPFDTRLYDANGNLVRVVRSCPGDANIDGSVTLADFTILASNFGLAVGAGYSQGDFSCDGAVNLVDFTILASNFGATCPLVNYEYDFGNRLVLIDDQDTGVTSTYEYDAMGRRTQKDVGGIETRFYYDGGWRVIEERDGGGSTNATYVFGSSIDDPLQMQRFGVDYYYHTDDTGNVRALTDGSGAVIERYEYDDYGRPLDPVNFNPIAGPPSSVDNPYLFAGRRYDSETGFYYFRTRYLDPVAGRFTSRDTIGAWGDGASLGNGYTYAGNNPASYIDPYGQDVWVGVGVGGSIGFVYGRTWWEGVVRNTSTGELCRITVSCERLGFIATLEAGSSGIIIGGPSDGRKLGKKNQFGAVAGAGVSMGPVTAGLTGSDSGAEVTAGFGLGVDVTFGVESCTTKVHWCRKPKKKTPPRRDPPRDDPPPRRNPPITTGGSGGDRQVNPPITPGWMGPGPEAGSPFEGRKMPGWMMAPEDEPVITPGPSPTQGSGDGPPSSTRPPVTTPGPGSDDSGAGGTPGGESTSCLGSPRQDQKVHVRGDYAR